LETRKRADLDRGATWTPDGRSLTYLVYGQIGSNVWVQPLGRAAPRPLTSFSQGYIYFYAFSRDGNRLYLARGYQVRDAVLIRGLRNNQLPQQ